MALRAKFKFETDVFFMILLRKIMKNTSVSKEYSAAEGGKNLFTQPQREICYTLYFLLFSSDEFLFKID